MPSWLPLASGWRELRPLTCLEIHVRIGNQDTFAYHSSKRNRNDSMCAPELTEISPLQVRAALCLLNVVNKLDVAIAVSRLKRVSPRSSIQVALSYSCTYQRQELSAATSDGTRASDAARTVRSTGKDRVAPLRATRKPAPGIRVAADHRAGAGADKGFDSFVLSSPMQRCISGLLSGPTFR